jgi:predicted phage gp36 major capsid-like protein
MREEKGRLANQANEILEKAKQDNRHDLRKEEEEKFDAIHADIDKLSAAIAREERQAATMASLESGGRRSEPNPIEQRGKQGASGRTSTGRSPSTTAKRRSARGRSAGSDCELTERQQKNAQRCGVNLAPARR